MSFQVGDFVEIIDSKKPEYIGVRSVITSYKPNAVGYLRDRQPWELFYYPGWRLLAPLKNDADMPVYWKAHQLKKINPPDWEAEKRDERKEQVA